MYRPADMSDHPDQPPQSEGKRHQHALWTFSTYFAEGFPYTIIRTVSSLFFRDRGMSLEALGVTSVFALPWVLKFLWGPVIDAYSRKRSWILTCEAILAVVILAATMLSPSANAAERIAVLFFFGSFIAATHDIAIDGYYLEALIPSDQARFLGFRVMAYRIAMMTGTGVIVTLGAFQGWGFAFALATLIMVALLALHWLVLPPAGSSRTHRPAISALLRRHPWSIGLAVAFMLGSMLLAREGSLPPSLTAKLPSLVACGLFAALILLWCFRHRFGQAMQRNPDSFYTRSFLTFIDRPGIGPILGFIILCRTGEYMLSSMYSPFMVDLGLKAHYGWISAGIGLPCSIVGAMAGGWAISKWGLRKVIWPLLLMQNLTNIVYMLVALHYDERIGASPAAGAVVTQGLLLAVSATHGFDQFAGGLGTAVLMTFLMRLCSDEFKASHYAIGTGLMSISGLYAGVISGFLTNWLGYGLFFGVSFLLSVPGMALICFIPVNGGESSATTTRHQTEKGE